MPERPFSKVLPPPPPATEGPHAELVARPLGALAEALRRRELSCRELTQAYLDRIEALDAPERLNAFITVAAERALADAERLDRRLGAGEPPGPLHGIPLGIKDALDTAGIRTTGGTKVLEHWVPPTDATVVRLLREAGAVVVGKPNLHEAGFGITSNNPHYGAVRNPYDPDRIPGGSSGGSAAAVASRLCAAALGTDTGGSVRIPPALCGGVGLKPTLGRTSKGGMMCLSWTCDVNGPITRSVADAALLLSVMAAGPDERDPVATAGPHPGDLAGLAASLPEDPGALRGLRVGLAGGYFAEGNHPDVDATVGAVAGLLAGTGAEVVEVAVADVEQATPAGFTIVVPETVVLTEAYWHQVDPSWRIEDQLERMGPDVRAVLGGERGPAAHPIPASAYLRAVRDTRAAVRRGFDRALEGVDVLLTPTAPSPAVPIAEDVEMDLNGARVGTFETFIKYCFCVSVAGLPAISVPGGQTTGGLPVGVQFVGRPWAERTLVEAAHAFEVLVSE